MENELDNPIGFRYNPTLETEVVMPFIVLSSHLPYSYVIEESLAR